MKKLGQNTPFTKDATAAVTRLLKHVDNNCLDNLPVGAGTNSNERVHRMLNRCTVAVPRIGPELANALLTSMFYIWNHQHSTKEPLVPVEIFLQNYG